MVSKEIGKELKAIRIRNGLTLQDVENALNIHKNTISFYENHSEKMKVNILEKLLNFYNVNIYIFFKTICEYIHYEN